MITLLGVIAQTITLLGGGATMTAHDQTIAAATILAVAEQGGDMDDVHTLLLVGWCESRHDPHAINPETHAAGIWQHMPNRTWGWPFRMRQLGLPETTPPSNILANARASAWLLLADAPGNGIGNWAASYDGKTCTNSLKYDIPSWITEIGEAKPR